MPASATDVLTDYLAEVEVVLNGEPFLLHFTACPAMACPGQVLGSLHSRGVLTDLVRIYYDLAEAGEEGQDKLWFYQKQRLAADMGSARLELREINAAAFRGVLSSLLDTVDRGALQLHSFYHQERTPEISAQWADRVEACLQSLHPSWRYYLVDPRQVELRWDKDNFYFCGLGNDACIVVHGGEHFLVLLTSGTD